MAAAGIKRLCVVGALATAGAVAAYDGWMVSHDRAPGEYLFRIYYFVLTMLLVFWVVADTKEARRSQPSFDYGWLIYLAFPVYVSYYVISTRRWRRGMLILIGMLFLFLLPFVAELCAIFVS